MWHCQVFKIGKRNQAVADSTPGSVRIWYVFVVQSVHEAYHTASLRWLIRKMPVHCTKGLSRHPVKDRGSLRNFQSRSNDVPALRKTD